MSGVCAKTKEAINVRTIAMAVLFLMVLMFAGEPEFRTNVRTDLFP